MCKRLIGPNKKKEGEPLSGSPVISQLVNSAQILIIVLSVVILLSVNLSSTTRDQVLTLFTGMA